MKQVVLIALSSVLLIIGCGKSQSIRQVRKVLFPNGTKIDFRENNVAKEYYISTVGQKLFAVNRKTKSKKEIGKYQAYTNGQLTFLLGYPPTIIYMKKINTTKYIGNFQDLRLSANIIPQTLEQYQSNRIKYTKNIQSAKKKKSKNYLRANDKYVATASSMAEGKTIGMIAIGKFRKKSPAKKYIRKECKTASIPSACIKAGIQKLNSYSSWE